jgi:cell division protein FtsW (lipid II flippase)
VTIVFVLSFATPLTIPGAPLTIVATLLLMLVVVAVVVVVVVGSRTMVARASQDRTGRFVDPVTGRDRPGDDTRFLSVTV